MVMDLLWRWALICIAGGACILLIWGWQIQRTLLEQKENLQTSVHLSLCLERKLSFCRRVQPDLISRLKQPFHRGKAQERLKTLGEKVGLKGLSCHESAQGATAWSVFFQANHEASCFDFLKALQEIPLFPGRIQQVSLSVSKNGSHIRGTVTYTGPLSAAHQ